MNDPYPQAGVSGPRCSFCGRSARDLENTLVEGPDVWICRHCVRQAAQAFGARLERVDDDGQLAEEDAEDADGPTPLDLGLSYEAIEELPAPLRDAVRDAWGGYAVEVVASGVEWHHKNLKRPSMKDLRAAAAEVARDCVWHAFETLNHHQ